MFPEKVFISPDGSSDKVHSDQDPKAKPTTSTEPVAVLSGKGRLDVAAEFLKLHEGEHGVYSAAEARKVLWKIDIRLVPLMTLTVALCAVDV